ncbi:sex-determining transformer protein 1-like [Anopheles stephensi]|uniref:sex-determining transformer protein 1-like n=1 Tax=Anopheles stephensi TaxID=30069 RepID=UPI001658AB96|nr:sex-determining transformer protein 1-like [Anopheles stephensi]
MALNTPKRLKTAVPPCANYLSTPPPSVSIGSPPPIETPSSAAANGQQLQLNTSAHTQHASWNQNNNWFSDATSPASSCSSPDGHQNRSYGGHNSSGTPHTWNTSSSGSAEKSENKRGRPRSEALTTLMVEGSISPSAIKCRFCNRVFPREKSLQAHLRTHTGERPYPCDYPGCTRAFTQSGQLKTHQRLHTGERPFICSVAHCEMRFTHANRHCPDHPHDTLKRCDDFVIQTVPEQNIEVLKWLEKYRAEREDRTPTRKTPKRNSGASNGGGCENGSGTTPGGSTAQNENENRRPYLAPRTANNENHLPLSGGNGAANVGGVADSSGSNAGIDNGQLLSSPVTPINAYKSSRKGLMDMNACMSLTSPVTAKSKSNSRPKLIHWQDPTSQEEDESGDECSAPSKQSTFNPKKKWLRDAWQDDLAKPLEPSLISQKLFSSTTSTMALKQQLQQESVTTLSPAKRQLLGVTGHSKPLPRMEGFSNVPPSMPVPALSTVLPVPSPVEGQPEPSVDPNQTRPTVLMVASKDCTRPLTDKPAAALQHNETVARYIDLNTAAPAPKPEETSRKLQGALALIQLAAKDELLRDSFDVQQTLVAERSTLYGNETAHSCAVQETNGHAMLSEEFAAEVNGLGRYS